MGVEPRTLVIPAAGLGTRVKRVDSDLPKEMLPIGSKPAIQYAVEEGLDAGMERIVIVISARKQIIRDHFSRFDHPITFLYQDEPSGEADAIALAEPIVGEGAFALIYPDNIHLPAPGALKQLIDVYRRYGHDVCALTAITKETAPCYGEAGRADLIPMSRDVYRIERLHPKRLGCSELRRGEDLRSCGVAVCGSHFFDAIREVRASIAGGEEFTDGPVISRIMQQRQWLAVRMAGTIYDIGSPEGYELCRKIAGERSLEPERPEG